MPELIQSQLPWLSPPWSIPSATLVVAVSAVFLALGAEWTVSSAVQVAERLRVGPQIIGLTLVAVGTSMPEFAVSLTAALDGGGSIAISNVVGSNIFNLGFILGGVALFRPLVTGPGIVWRDGSVLIASSLAVWLLFGIDLGVERSNGALLLLGLVTYLTVLVTTSRLAPTEPDGTTTDPAAGPGLLRIGLSLTGGVAVVAMSAELLVEAASSIAASLGLSEWVIGITIVAAGTSLPELTTSLIAAARGHYGLSLGNIIGSDIFNVLGVLGLTAVIQPLRIGPEASGSILSLVAMVVLTVILMRTGWRLGRAEGAVLVALGLLRWVLDFRG